MRKLKAYRGIVYYYVDKFEDMLRWVVKDAGETQVGVPRSDLPYRPELEDARGDRPGSIEREI